MPSPSCADLGKRPSAALRPRLVTRHRTGKCARLASHSQRALSLVVCIVSAVMTVPSRDCGLRFQQQPEVGDLVRRAGLGHLVLADHQSGDVGNCGEQVHLLLPARRGQLAFLARPLSPPDGQARGRDHQSRPHPARDAWAPHEPGHRALVTYSASAACGAACSFLPAGRGVRSLLRQSRSSAAGASHADRHAPSSSASGKASSRPKLDADGGLKVPVTGFFRVPCAASTSGSQLAAAPPPAPASPASAGSLAACVGRSAVPLGVC